MTLFWAVGGIHRGDAERVTQNQRFIRSCQGDYQRILGQVNWTGEAIDPFRPEYPDALAAAIDSAWAEGLRTQLTAIGGGCKDPVTAARIMAGVLETRREAILMIEAVNEDNASEEDAVAVAKVFAGLGLPFGVGLGDRGLDTIKTRGRQAQATVSFLHTERTVGDDGARQVRQCWDFKGFDGVAVENEPPGIASSVAVFTDPFKMAAKRAGDLICGAAAFCLHAGAGVFGRYMTGSYGVRQANLFEVPGLEAMAVAVKHAEDHLPLGIEAWAKFNTTQPVKVVAGSVNKLYGSRQGDRFAEIAIGCEGPAHTLQAKEACYLRVVNPATGEVLLDQHLATDETVEVSGLWCYLLIGTRA